MLAPLIALLAPMTAQMVPTSISMTGHNAWVTTAAVTPLVFDGFGGLTINWTLVSGPPSALRVNSPHSLTTTFSGFVDGIAYQNVSGVFKCTVTDGTGQTASATISLTFTQV